MSTHETFSFGYTSYDVTVEPGKFVIVKRKDEKPVKFEIGDTAEYDSYNLKYLGKITSITSKTVTIQPKYETRKRRLKLQDFAWRNWDYDFERISHENFETMMYI